MSNNATWHLECNNKSFINKLQAIAENNISKQPIRFNTPAKYETFDFSRNIDQSLEELCVAQAKKLRREHDTVNIFYSGGCDSHYILEIFLANNIKIDNIIMVKSGFEEADFEIDQYALPFVEKLNVPFDLRMPDMNYYEDYYYNHAMEPRTQHEFWHHFRLNNHFENVIDTPNAVVNIFGKEKPTVLHRDNNWYTYFLDIDITPQPGQFNFFVDDPAIHSKQCQILVENIIKHKPPSEYNKVTHFDKHQDFWNRSIGRYNQIDFPLKVLEIDGHFNNKDQSALDQAPVELISAWKQRNKLLTQAYGEAWFNQKDPALGTVGVFSKFYGLTENITKTVDDLFPNGFFIQ